MIACPKCGSAEHYFKVSALYENDTTNTANVTSGVGLGLSGGAVVGLGSSLGTQQTLIAARLAPPVAPVKAGSRTSVYVLAMIGVLGAALFAYFGEFLIAVSIIVLVSIAVAAFLNSLSRHDDLAQKHRGALARWQRQWVCKRCGEVSEPSRT